jgi:hypothetical protein
MTTYPKLTADDVKQWDGDYEQLQLKFAQEQDDQEKAKLTAAMQSLAVRVEERLTKDIQTVRRYSKTRRHNADAFVIEAQNELKLARVKAAEFKKKPSKTGLPPQVRDSIKKISEIEKAFQDDGQDYGTSWFEYRGAPINKVPAKHAATFNAVQGTIVNDDKPLGVALQKIVAARHEAEALLAITNKAAMKADIKAGTGTQRPIADAQAAAKDLATQMDALLKLLQHPVDASTPPDGITSVRETLTGVSKEAGFLNKPGALKVTRSNWSNAQIAYKLMMTKGANMEKVLATKTKGFRSKELDDPVVKAHLKEATQKVKEAQKTIKDKDADYAAAKKMMDKLEAQAKKLKIK